MPNAVAVPATHLLEWFGISLTQARSNQDTKTGGTFWQPQAVFRVSLTELESTGIQAVSAQSIATGKSAELAHEEIARAAAAGVTMLSFEDPAYPPRLKEIYDPPLVLYVRGHPEFSHIPASQWLVPTTQSPYGSGMAEWLASDLAAQGAGNYQRHGSWR